MNSLRVNVFITLFIFICSKLAAQTIDQEIMKIAVEANGHIGAGLLVIETNKSAWLNKNDHFPMQSVYKFPIGMAVLAQVDAGLIKLDELVRVKKSELIGQAQHSPIRDKHPEGNFKMSVRELLRYAVSESDGSASDVLMRRIGGPKQVMKFLKSIGIININVVDTEFEIGRNDSVQYRNWATPSSAVELLKAFCEGKGLKAESRKFLMKLMTDTDTGLNRLKGLLPKDAIVSHKTGSSRTVNGITAATNDIGIINLPNKKHLLVAVFVSDSKAGDTIRDKVIAEIARIGWDKFQ